MKVGCLCPNALPCPHILAISRTLSTNPRNTPTQHIISNHPLDIPFQHALSTHPINTSSQKNLSIFPQPTLSINIPSHTPYHPFHSSGGGIKRSNMNRIWSYLYTTADPEVLQRMLGDPLVACYILTLKCCNAC